MQISGVEYLVPYFISFLISSGVALYAWNKRSVGGARFFAWLAGGQALWTFGFILELSTPSLSGKIFWDAFQWLGAVSIILAFPAFTVEYAGYKIRHPRLFWGGLAVVPILFTGLVLTSGYHPLLYPNPHLVPGKPFASLDYDFTTVFKAFSLYSYAVIFGCLVALGRRFLRPYELYRSQITIIAVGTALPIFATVLPLIGIDFTPQRDPTPFTFAIGNLVISWGLFRYHLFDIVPVARDTVVENITDPIVVLDMQDRIVDLNPAALAEIGLSSRQVIGSTAHAVFAAWSELFDQFQGSQPGHTEIKVAVRGEIRYYELNISPLYSRTRQMIGRLFISRDISERRRLEETLRHVNEDLEDRVRERTSELARAYDTTLRGWAKALELRDKETEGHSRRVTEITIELGRAMGLNEDDLVQLERGALLHDIGKMAIPDEILQKRGDLTEDERKIVARHPVIAYELLAPIDFLSRALEIPYCHHEKWNGEGYPQGLKGEAIPLSARIFSVADVWDALRSDRPYRKAWSREVTGDYIQKKSGEQFDPHVVQVFMELFDQGRI